MVLTAAAAAKAQKKKPTRNSKQNAQNQPPPFVSISLYPQPDHAQAAEWFRLAAERGVAEAAVNLAEMCRLGLGMPRGEPRPDEARRWLKRAEALGNHFASDLLEDGAELDDRRKSAAK